MLKFFAFVSSLLLQFKAGTESHDATLRAETETSIRSIQETAKAKQDEVIKILLDIVTRVHIVRRNEAEVKA